MVTNSNLARYACGAISVIGGFGVIYKNPFNYAGYGCLSTGVMIIADTMRIGKLEHLLFQKENPSDEAQDRDHFPETRQNPPIS